MDNATNNLDFPEVKIIIKCKYSFCRGRTPAQKFRRGTTP